MFFYIDEKNTGILLTFRMDCVNIVPEGCIGLFFMLQKFDISEVKGFEDKDYFGVC